MYSENHIQGQNQVKEKKYIYVKEQSEEQKSPSQVKELLKH
jgi:hypothetical protein